jgi:hypothetical protein
MAKLYKHPEAKYGTLSHATCLISSLGAVLIRAMSLVDPFLVVLCLGVVHSHFQSGVQSDIVSALIFSMFPKFLCKSLQLKKCMRLRRRMYS